MIFINSNLLSARLEYLFLFLGLFAIVLISLFIARQIGRQVSRKAARFTFLFVLLLAGYYIIDTVSKTDDIVHNVFFYFWLIVIISQGLLFFAFRSGPKRDVH